MAFPEWGAKFGWETAGIRKGEVEGRDATTVYYEKEGKTLAYTIVGGDALDVPDDAKTVTVEGTPINLFRTERRPPGRHVGARRPHLRAGRRRRPRRQARGARRLEGPRRRRVLISRTPR